jgi:Na+/H+ antiporter NhaA
MASHGRDAIIWAVAAKSERTAWARNLAAPVRDYLSTESGGALVLLGAAVAALVWANGPWKDSYESVWTTVLSIRLGGSGITMDLREWVNKGLMTFFFLVVGLEAKRELDVGQLRDRSGLAPAAGAAIGGVAFAVGIYLAFNHDGHAHGWGAAMSTDTAFALGVLALVAPQGTRLRVRMLTITVVDDLIALLVIATFYSSDLQLGPLLMAVAIFVVLLALRFVPIGPRRPLAVLGGVALWVALLKSGIDPLISGLAIGLITTAYPPARADLEQVTQVTRRFREQPTPELARSAQLQLASAISPNDQLQYRLHPWTSYVIVPLFALANAGIEIDGELLERAATSPITLGIALGYVLGKPIGVLTGAWLAEHVWRGGLPLAISWPVLAGGGIVAGIGFTVSLLVSSIAFTGDALEEAKIGVLAAALLSTALSALYFRGLARVPAPVRARQIGRTADDLVDLATDVDPARDHIRGAPDASVTLVEYGDYECSYCGRAEVIIRELLNTFGDDLRYVWRHLPLNDVHVHTQMAAEAAEAAAAQGHFWDMHEMLLTHQGALEPADLDDYARELGLDTERFWDDLRSRRYAERVSEDVESADAGGVAGTPSFFINGRRHEGAYDVTILSAEVRAAERRAAAKRLAV